VRFLSFASTIPVGRSSGAGRERQSSEYPPTTKIRLIPSCWSTARFCRSMNKGILYQTAPVPSTRLSGRPRSVEVADVRFCGCPRSALDEGITGLRFARVEHLKMGQTANSARSSKRAPSRDGPTQRLSEGTARNSLSGKDLSAILRTTLESIEFLVKWTCARSRTC
jgi:hypothetical protein